MKYVLVLILGLVAGYFIPKPTVETQLPSEKSEKLQNFIDQEAKAFATLQDADAKLKAAEEMYGKMMILFLADLGLKSSHQFTPAVATVKEQVKEEIIRDEAPVEEKEKVLASTHSILAQAKKLTPAQAKKEANQERYDKYRSAHYLDSFEGDSKRLLGNFKGVMIHISGNNSGRKDSVAMSFNLTQTGKNISGDTLVTMTDANGHEYSRNAGNGGNRALKSIPQEPESYYVEASPTSYFVINLKSFPHVTGEYFERGKLIGKVNLQKFDGLE